MAEAAVLLRIADLLVPAFRKAFLAAVSELNGELTTPEILAALQRGDVRALDATGAWQAFRDKLDPQLRQAVTDAITKAGTATVAALPPSVRAQLRFDLTNPKALAAIDTVVAQSVETITNASREGVKAVLRQGYLNGLTPQEIARRVRDSLGLTDRAATAVEHFRQGLLDTDVPEGRANDLAGQYADRLLRQRATMIARTESIRAASAGQQGAWLDAAQAGLLDRASARRFWLVTPDDRLCPLCEAIPDLNPDGVALDEPFQTEGGPINHPPAHPLCRCAVTLHTTKETVTG